MTREAHNLRAAHYCKHMTRETYNLRQLITASTCLERLITLRQLRTAGTRLVTPISTLHYQKVIVSLVDYFSMYCRRTCLTILIKQKLYLVTVFPLVTTFIHDNLKSFEKYCVDILSTVNSEVAKIRGETID